jgi:hypothetical protein
MKSKSEEVLREFQARSKSATRPSIASLIKKWTEFTVEVEKGYELTIYDYTNDLSSRDLLQELSDRDPQVKEEIMAVIEPADKRFMLATRQSDGVLRPSASPDEWWWHRLPKKQGGELKRDLDDL